MRTYLDNRTDPLDERLRKQAWIWLRTLNSGDVKSWDLEGFRRWLHTSQAHKDAFNAAKQEWEAYRPVAGEVLRRDPDVAGIDAHLQRGNQQGRWNRRAFLGAAIGTAAVATGVAVIHPPGGLWPAPGEWRADYRTGTGEQRAIDLADQVRLTLNTQTRIRRRTAGDRIVGIDLLAGEAAIDLPHAFAGGRPFTVVAGAGRILASGGRFEVRRLQGKACVTCVEGVIRMEHPQGQRQLLARDRMFYDDSALGSVEHIDPRQLPAWRKGELVFEKTPLIEVIDEINRYRPGRVVLMNASVREQPVSGSFYIAALDKVLDVLRLTFNLDARSLPGGLLVLS